MNSPKNLNNKKKKEALKQKQISQNFQQASDSLEIKPWNSNKLAFISSCLGKKTTNHNIFSLSNHSSNIISKQKQTPLIVSKSYAIKSLCSKPQSAPQKVTGRKKNFKTTYPELPLSQELTKLGQVATQQVLDGNFEQKLQSINFYPQFRAYLQQRKNLMYLKPYIKSNNDRKKYNMSTYNGMQKLKTELYQGIRESQNIYIQKQKQNQVSQTIKNNQNLQTLNPVPHTNRSSIIQYMTQYQGEPLPDFQQKIVYKSTRKSTSGRQKYTSLCVLRQKLKNRYRESVYADKIVMIKRGEGIPITVIQ